jgi:hypothetical protein
LSKGINSNRGERKLRCVVTSTFFRRSAACLPAHNFPTADALGYIPPPLRGFRRIKAELAPLLKHPASCALAAFS